jgi:phosphoribosyl-ATP pyrophosphohydrolase/phosphoribosyl-AMP cyclohydrolase
MDMKLNERGLIPAIAQDIDSGQILMMGYMSPGALKRTLEGGQVWYYSRSREDLWHKGEVSGNYLNLKEAWVDCDADTILMKVTPDGPTCHTGEPSCFFTPLDGMPGGFQSEEASAEILEELFATIQERKRDLPEGSYTAKLFQSGVGRVAQKVIEEAGETALAAAQGDSASLPAEAADLLYHTLVLLAASGVTPNQVWEELRSRQR